MSRLHPRATPRPRATGALERTRRSNQRRLVRTVVLGALAVGAAIVWLASEFGMDGRELVGYALTSFGLVLGMVLLAVLGAGLLRALKKLLGSR